MFVLMMTFLFPANVFAQVKPKTIVKLPMFTAGEILTIDKPIEGDLMIAGQKVKIVSNVNGDTYVAGGEVEISGEIKGNLIVAGGKVTIGGKVAKNLIMVGGQVMVSDLATIGGYVLAGGNKLDLLGNFSGPVKVGAKELWIGEKAVINGNLEADVNKSNISSTAKIIGEKKIQIHEIKQPEKESYLLRKYASKAIFSFLSKLVLVLVLVKLLGGKIINLSTKNSFWSNFGLGLIVLIVTPFLMLILVATLIGISLSGIILSLYLVFLSLAGAVAAIIIGNYISQKGYIKTNNLYLQGFIGLLVLTLLGFLPSFIGLIARFIFFLFGLGILFNGLKQYLFNK